MRAFLFHLLLGLLFVTAATARLPFSTPLAFHPDLCLFYVLFAAFFRPPREAATVAGALGLCLDAYSGAAFGLYTVVYLWLVCAVAWIPRYADVENTVFIAVACAFATLAEGLFLSAAAAFISRRGAGSVPGLSEWIISAVFAALAGPWAIRKLNGLFSRFRGRAGRMGHMIFLADIHQNRLD